MNGESWTEIDIYWFQGGEVDDKVKALFDRFAPVWDQRREARKGIALCAGWLFDSVLYWNREPEALIACCQPPVYEAWTYRRFGELVGAIKREAAIRGLTDFHVALMLLADASMDFDHESNCEGCVGRTEQPKDRNIYAIRGNWFYEHPEIDRRQFGLYYFGSPVHVPDGEEVCKLPAPTFGEYFADKLCDLAEYTGLGGVVLRDHVFAPAYCRGNLLGERYQHPERAALWTESFIRLFRRIKSIRPQLLIIGYGSGSSSVEEWRSHGFDLERVATAGDLDIWITQTWASAWQDYWPAHSLGYTFQLTSLLVQMAMLANTPCKHIFLIETFDAWEPWDAVHQYPHKAKWELWAYSHASLLLPGGEVRHPDGFYMSWMNNRQDLLPEETVASLCATLRACREDLLRNPVPVGPTLVYHRDGMAHLLGDPQAHSRGEEIDDWASMLAKYGTPVISATRSEWIGSMEPDGLLFPAPACLDDRIVDRLLDLLRRGTPIVFTGQAALLPERLRRELGIVVAEEPVLEPLPCAVAVAPALAREIGTTAVVVNQRARTLRDSPQWTSWLTCDGDPVFAEHADRSCWIWETPEWGTPRELHLTNQSIQSPQTYAAVARAINREGWGAGKLGWDNADWQKPMCMLAWRYPDGELAVLLGNLETGVTGNSQYGAKGELRYVADAGRAAEVGYAEVFAPGIVEQRKQNLHVKLAGHKAGLINIRI